MKFIKRVTKAQQSVYKKIEEKITQLVKSKARLETEAVLSESNRRQQLWLQDNKNKQIKEIVVDQNLRHALQTLRHIVGDTDTENKLKVKDLINAIEIYKNNLPPEEQILSGFELTPIYTDQGPAYPSTDGTQAWIKNETGTYLVTNFNMFVSDDLYEDKQHEEEISTSDVIEAYLEFDGDFLDFKNNLDIDAPSVNQGLQQIWVAENVADKTLNMLEKIDLDGMCKQDRLNWKAILFWLLVMNFNSDRDLVRTFVKVPLKGSEYLLNKFIHWLKGIGLDYDGLIIHIHWHPFANLKYFTWWEDLLFKLQEKEYNLMCSFIRFQKDLTLGSTQFGAGNQYLNDHWSSWNNTQRQLAICQLGFNKFHSGRMSVSQVKSILGQHIFDGNFWIPDQGETV